VGDGKQPAGKFSLLLVGEPAQRGCGKNPVSAASPPASAMATAAKLCALVDKGSAVTLLKRSCLHSAAAQRRRL
jgi:hypothetical protein